MANSSKSLLAASNLASAIEALVQATQRLKYAGEPVLLMRVSGLLKECQLKQDRGAA